MVKKQCNAGLQEMLLQIRPEAFPEFLAEHGDEMIRSSRPFTEFMRARFREKGLLQQDVFLAANLPERQGYRLISGEKHTNNRDVILRLCLAARFRLDEVQEALILYGMAPLDARFPRDAAFMLAFHNRIFEIYEVDAILRASNLPPFLTPDPSV